MGRSRGVFFWFACGVLVPVVPGAFLVTPASGATTADSAVTACAKQVMASTPTLLEGGVKKYEKICSAAGGSGPWAVRVLTVNPTTNNSVEVTVARSTKITGALEEDYALKRLSALASDSKAIAAVNGGYFVRNPEVAGFKDAGVAGESAGLSVVDGKVLSEPTNARAVLVLGDGGKSPEIVKYSTGIELLVMQEKNGQKTEKYRSGVGGVPWIDGINRIPGKIRNCGGIDDTPTLLPRHDVTCGDTGELVFLTTNYGSPRPVGAGREIIMDDAGKVLEIRKTRGDAVVSPDTKRFLQATGSELTWIDKIATGDLVATRLVDAASMSKKPEERVEVTFRKNDAVVNGGPVLVSGGVPTDFAADGEKAYVEDGLKYDGVNEASFRAWVGPTNARTLAGFATTGGARGTIYLVTVDGKQKSSQGLSIPDAAQVMVAIGAQEAINLDGGGSTTMVAGGEVVNCSSDPLKSSLTGPSSASTDCQQQPDAGKDDKAQRQRWIADAVVIQKAG